MLECDLDVGVNFKVVSVCELSGRHFYTTLQNVLSLSSAIIQLRLINKDMKLKAAVFKINSTGLLMLYVDF